MDIELYRAMHEHRRDLFVDLEAFVWATLPHTQEKNLVTYEAKYADRMVEACKMYAARSDDDTTFTSEAEELRKACHADNMFASLLQTDVFKGAFGKVMSSTDCTVTVSTVY